MTANALLDMLGLCELRDHGSARPRRSAVSFEQALVSDDAPRRTTRVTRTTGVSGGGRMRVTLGAEDWSRTFSIGPQEVRVYEDGGSWFAHAAGFSDASVIEIQTVLAVPLDLLLIVHLGTAVVRADKTFVNLGPSPISLAALPTGEWFAPGSLRLPPVTGGVRVLLPGAAIRLRLDPVDSRWLVPSGAAISGVPDDALLDDESGEPLLDDDSEDFLLDG